MIFFSFFDTALATKGEISPFSATLLDKKISRFTPVTLTGDTSRLAEGDKKALDKIIQAAKLLDAIYLRQVWAGNVELKKKLEVNKSRTGQKLLHYFRQNVGPWSRLDGNEVFVSGAPKEKPKGAGFYPEGMSKEEFENWTKTLSSADKEKATGFFWTIRRNQDGTLTTVPYSKEYREFLEPAAKLLKEAAEHTPNKTLKKYLTLRAEAFLSDNYYDSDVAWMDLDAPIDVTIGPYETYEDELFGYKAAFEAFVTLRNEQESAKLVKFSHLLQEIENNLPIDNRYKNPKLGALAPIRVVDQVYSSGEARRGVATIAFNLPNDEKVIKEKGSKRVMLKNAQEAKFQKILLPIAKKLLDKKEVGEVKFEPFFTHILMHELMHGLGPQNINVAGNKTTVRKELKELYSAIEEAKADITGLYAMQYLMDKGVIEQSMQDSMYLTFLASSFRSVRFGVGEAHGKGMALQFNYLAEKGAFTVGKDGRYAVNRTNIKEAVKNLTHEILTLEAEGSYVKAKAMLDKYGSLRPDMQKALKQLHDIPVDIELHFAADATEAKT
ncbi:MAG: hypothetical protein HY537_00985 [Deltaproteobacteria bacterium]|nr:hypothetical protein [Deltaproteobacteria bacterium]